MKGEESSRSKGTSNATGIAGSFTTAQNVPVQDDYKCCFSTKLFNRTKINGKYSTSNDIHFVMFVKHNLLAIGIPILYKKTKGFYHA